MIITSSAGGRLPLFDYFNPLRVTVEYTRFKHKEILLANLLEFFLEKGQIKVFRKNIHFKKFISLAILLIFNK